MQQDQLEIFLVKRNNSEIELLALLCDHNFR
jgi:hypothetical protein